MISGMLVRDEFVEKDSLDLQRKKLKKRLSKANEHKSKLLKLETYQTWYKSDSGQEPFRNIDNGEMIAKMKRDCLLFDERDPLSEKNKIRLKIDKNAQRLNEVFNLRHKRTMDNWYELQEKIKYAAIEGGSMTLLGLVKYSAENDSFIMTEFSTVLSGGIFEAKR